MARKRGEGPLRTTLRSIIAALNLMSGLFLLVSCQKGQVGLSSSAQPQDSASHLEKRRVVYFGVISRYDPRIMYQGYQPIMDYLTANTDYHFELKLGKTYEDAVEYLRTGETEITSFGAFTYIEAHLKFGAESILKPKAPDGRPFYHSIIITRADSPIDSLKDLKGKRFAFASLSSTSGNLIPRHVLADHGIHLQDLASYENLKHHDSVANAVLRGQVDAGAVKDIVANKYKEKGLKFIYLSDPIPSVPIAVRKDADTALVRQVQEALLRLDPKNPVDRDQMKDWNEEFRNGFAEAQDSDYDPIREKIFDIPKGCGKTCHHHQSGEIHWPRGGSAGD